MADSIDLLGGYTLEELLGAAPLTKSAKQMKKESHKRGIVSTVVGAPFRIVVALIKAPVTLVARLVGGLTNALTELVKLPFRMVGALTSPWRNH